MLVLFECIKGDIQNYTQSKEARKLRKNLAISFAKF